MLWRVNDITYSKTHDMKDKWIDGETKLWLLQKTIRERLIENERKENMLIHQQYQKELEIEQKLEFERRQREQNSL